MSDLIRISCASLCRIEHLGRFFLLLNANRRAKGIYILSPIGGALSVHDPALLDAFHAIPENPATNDLRLAMPVEVLPAFRTWFYSGQGRERSPYRELYEELVVESKLLPALAAEDMDWRHLWTVEDQAFTQRQGQTGLLTHYFLEIYDVTFKTSAALGPLLIAPADSGAAWVSADVIEQQGTVSMSVDGADREVRVNAYYLLHSKPPPSPQVD